MKKSYRFIFILITVSVGLFSCAQAPTPEVNYYLLNTPEQNISANTHAETIDEHSAITLVNVVLPQYLKQSSIVMLMNENQLHYARYHLWGESLTSAIAKIMNQSLMNTALVNKALSQQLLPQNAKQQVLHLVVEIDHFYPTDQARVILSGRYWLTNKNTKVKNSKQAFDFAFKQTLTADGYGQAVKQMHVLVKQLTENIIQQAKVFSKKTIKDK